MMTLAVSRNMMTVLVVAVIFLGLVIIADIVLTKKAERNIVDGLVEIKRDTHLVIKREDVEKYLSPRQKKQLQKLIDSLVRYRMEDGEKINHYYVCNTDEPYAEEVLQLILLGEEKKSFCENINGEKCSIRDYGQNQYKEACYECCLGCAGAINMECTLVCTKVAEHYHPTEEDETS